MSFSNSSKIDGADAIALYLVLFVMITFVSSFGCPMTISMYRSAGRYILCHVMKIFRIKEQKAWVRWYNQRFNAIRDSIDHPAVKAALKAARHVLVVAALADSYSQDLDLDTCARLSTNFGVFFKALQVGEELLAEIGSSWFLKLFLLAVYVAFVYSHYDGEHKPDLPADDKKPEVPAPNYAELLAPAEKELKLLEGKRRKEAKEAESKILGLEKQLATITDMFQHEQKHAKWARKQMNSAEDRIHELTNELASVRGEYAQQQQIAQNFREQHAGCADMGTTHSKKVRDLEATIQLNNGRVEALEAALTANKYACRQDHVRKDSVARDQAAALEAGAADFNARIQEQETLAQNVGKELKEQTAVAQTLGKDITNLTAAKSSLDAALAASTAELSAARNAAKVEIAAARHAAKEELDAARKSAQQELAAVLKNSGVTERVLKISKAEANSLRRRLEEAQGELAAYAQAAAQTQAQAQAQALQALDEESDSDLDSEWQSNHGEERETDGDGEEEEEQTDQEMAEEQESSDEEL